jgi:hypothetical protein
MTVKVTDLSPQFLKQYRDASRMALDAAAALYEGNVKKRFMKGYYTSQAFRSTAQIVQHVMRDEPTFGGNGWYTNVGVPDGIMAKPKSKKSQRKFFRKLARGTAMPASVGMIALAWEVGHRNIFRRKNGVPQWSHVPIFKPVAIQSMQAMIDTYNRVLNRYMERGRPVR